MMHWKVRRNRAAPSRHLFTPKALGTRMPGTPGRRSSGTAHASYSIRWFRADTPSETRTGVSTPAGTVGAATYGESIDLRGAY